MSIEFLIYLMAGAHLAKESGVPQRILKIVNDKLDSYIKETEQTVRKQASKVTGND